MARQTKQSQIDSLTLDLNNLKHVSREQDVELNKRKSTIMNQADIIIQKHQNCIEAEKKRMTFESIIDEQGRTIAELEQHTGEKVTIDMVKGLELNLNAVRAANINLQGDISEAGNHYERLLQHSQSHQVAIGAMASMWAKIQNQT